MKPLALAATLVLVLAACEPSTAKPAAYGAELEECTRRSITLTESVKCENEVRARYGRPPRALDAGRD